eukprot:COSAG06_NODE_1628_length_8880_cov_51.017993_11_plen_25_part_01
MIGFSLQRYYCQTKLQVSSSSYPCG